MVVVAQFAIEKVGMEEIFEVPIATSELVRSITQRVHATKKGAEVIIAAIMLYLSTITRRVAVRRIHFGDRVEAREDQSRDIWGAEDSEVLDWLLPRLCHPTSQRSEAWNDASMAAQIEGCHNRLRQGLKISVNLRNYAVSVDVVWLIIALGFSSSVSNPLDPVLGT